eukprot:gnl/TRDRNA2_/TRDRNA2_86298_c0_seq1.p1 gnl/TRDRNA2_/TRDRNA2_86298_c0~~gnl/TRDRNA2_/TRDRNA2_86298_c0_seq1.p1  ORF type:complete len:122 (-),score=12.90 gnl/TRDRNA2_/TRDRNA2_86298_c0_seq1:254-619(-)
MQPEGKQVLTPWWDGEVQCDSQRMFNGCDNEKCHSWDAAITLPPTPCMIYNYGVQCPSNLHAWLVEHFGPEVSQPDRPTRSNPGTSPSFVDVTIGDQDQHVTGRHAIPHHHLRMQSATGPR